MRSRSRTRSTTLLAAAGMVGAVALAACTPGSNSDTGGAAPTGSVTTDAAKLGDVTLTVWDQEVRGGQAAQIE